MSPETTSAAQRAYDEIKRLILDGSLPARSRLDLEDLARKLGVSSMPVRSALSLLTWERLVRPGEHSAYEVALWSAPELAQLYEWRGVLLTLVLPTAVSGPELERLARTQPYVQAVESVMRLLEDGANANLKRAALNADERLHVARVAELDVLADAQSEFEALVGAIARRTKRVSTLVKSYQRRRVQGAEAIRERVALKALPNNGAPR
ncbi:MAG: GntR family transcriptional regulator [Devosia sp.]|jgi:DNA-binding GntR family transcriptional regulator